MTQLGRFVVGMLLSPIVAAIALISLALYPRFGLFVFLPAMFWCALLALSLFLFKWRGLWFLAGPPMALIWLYAALVMSCGSNACIGSFP